MPFLGIFSQSQGFIDPRWTPYRFFALKKRFRMVSEPSEHIQGPFWPFSSFLCLGKRRTPYKGIFQVLYFYENIETKTCSRGLLFCRGGCQSHFEPSNRSVGPPMRQSINFKLRNFRFKMAKKCHFWAFSAKVRGFSIQDGLHIGFLR